MFDFMGTHGTCRTNADSICRNNFFLSTGRHGKGIYLWNATRDTLDDAILLASSYAEHSRASGKFRSKNDDSVTVLICETSLPKENFLDLESIEWANALRTYILRYESRLRALTNESQVKQELSKIYDGFLAELEELANAKILIYHVKAATPPPYRGERSLKGERSLGFNWATQFAASCLVVRDKSVIPLTAIRKV